MASTKDLEKGEAATVGTGSTAYQSDNEKRDSGEIDDIAQGATGEPDEGHEELEVLDSGHMQDLERRTVRLFKTYS